MNIKHAFYGAMMTGLLSACGGENTQNPPARIVQNTSQPAESHFALSIRSKITNAFADEFIGQLRAVERQNPRMPVLVTINSSGGSADAAERIIRALERSPNPITLHCQRAYSAAGVIFATTKGVHRDAASNCEAMIHQGRYYSKGYTVDINVLEGARGGSSPNSSSIRIPGTSIEISINDFNDQSNLLYKYREQHTRDFANSTHFDIADMNRIYNRRADVYFKSGAELVWAGLADTVNGRKPSDPELARAGGLFCSRLDIDVSICP
jgi:ATP-dependent protease ClpP protease subunit